MRPGYAFFGSFTKKFAQKMCLYICCVVFVQKKVFVLCLREKEKNVCWVASVRNDRIRGPVRKKRPMKGKEYCHGGKIRSPRMASVPPW